MPELPEVETLKLGLQKYVVGHKIEDIDVRDPHLLSGEPKDIIGAKFKDVRRYAKGIVLDLDNGYSIAVHIKLTGQLIFRDETNTEMLVMKPIPMTVPNKFTRVIFKLGSGPHPNPLPEGEGMKKGVQNKKDSGQARMTGPCFLYFQEVRGFAWMKILKTDEVLELPFFKALGPEPFPSPGTETPKLTEKMLETMASKSRLAIKVLLMDQKRIGGIGNIYANDSLFDAGIDPRRPANSLTPTELKKLYKSIIKVLETGFKYRGSSELNYVNVLGEKGEYQKHALVYGKKNKPCIKCGNTVQKIYLGGRGTFFCTNCQK